MIPTDTPEFRVDLFFREGASDKVYLVELLRSRDGYVVNFAYGRRGSTLTTGTKTTTPVPLEKAKKIAEKLIFEKKAKGYTECGATGTPYARTEREGQVSPYLPQLLNPVEESQLDDLLNDSRYACQQKIDGRRLILLTAFDQVRAVNRRGLFVGCPEHWGRGLPVPCVLDGEGVGDDFHAFDLLELNGENYADRPFRDRYVALEKLLANHRPGGVPLVRATADATQKRAWLERFRAEQLEGIVFKSLDAPYTPGRPASGGTQLKFKFTQSGTFVVTAVSAAKRSVAVGAFDRTGQLVPLGNVTVPSNHAVPQPQTLVEIRFLYRYVDGSLFQPVYLGVRDDLETSAASVDQIHRVKDTASEAEEA